MNAAVQNSLILPWNVSYGFFILKYFEIFWPIFANAGPAIVRKLSGYECFTSNMSSQRTRSCLYTESKQTGEIPGQEAVGRELSPNCSCLSLCGRWKLSLCLNTFKWPLYLLFLPQENRTPLSPTVQYFILRLFLDVFSVKLYRY